MRYAEHVELDETMRDAFWQIIKAIDVGYLEWMKNEHGRTARSLNRKGRTATRAPAKGQRSRSRRSYGR